MRGETYKIIKTKFIQFITNHLQWLIVILVVLILLALIVSGGYLYFGHWRWTGLFPFETTLENQEIIFYPGKTLWDWMGLLIIPAVLAGGAILLNRAQRQRELEIATEERNTERQIAKDREEERALQSYLDAMTKLLLEEDLRNSEEDAEVRSIARARTLTILGSLDEWRKASVLRFLYEAKLIQVGGEVVNLAGAILVRAWLTEANLSGANLSGAKLREAYLMKAKLREADLREANLTEADLDGANLEGADLSGAYLWDAILWEANLEGADLSGAYLAGANLRGAKLEEADLEGAKLVAINVKGAVVGEVDLFEASYNSKTRWPDGFDPEKAGAINIDNDQEPKKGD